jgi:hypothetical protein
MITVEEYLKRVPDDETWAIEATRPYRAMSPSERLHELSILNGWMDSILGDRTPTLTDGEPPFWRLWRGLGCAR